MQHNRSNTLANEARWSAVSTAFIALMAVVSLASCRSIASTLGDANASPQSRLQWVTLPTLDPVDPTDKLVYVRYRNLAGATEFSTLSNQLEHAITARGYRITRNPDEAAYYVDAVLRFFDLNPHADRGDSLLAAAGGVAAGTAGWGLAGAVTDSSIIKGGVAIGLGAATGQLIKNLSKVVEWNLLLDVAIGERQEGGVETSLQSGNEATRADLTGKDTGGQLTGGSDVGRQERKQEATVTSDFYRHEARLLAVAWQIGMERTEAVELLRPRLGGLFSELMP